MLSDARDNNPVADPHSLLGSFGGLRCLCPLLRRLDRRLPGQPKPACHLWFQKPGKGDSTSVSQVSGRWRGPPYLAKRVCVAVGV